MTAGIALQTTKIRTGSRDAEARLVFFADELVAILVRLDDPVHEAAQRGGWFVEASFGLGNSSDPPVFRDLAAAAEWVGVHAGPS